jgi:hypothetical protein
MVISETTAARDLETGSHHVHKLIASKFAS